MARLLLAARASAVPPLLPSVLTAWDAVRDSAGMPLFTRPPSALPPFGLVPATGLFENRQHRRQAGAARCDGLARRCRSKVALGAGRLVGNRLQQEQGFRVLGGVAGQRTGSGPHTHKSGAA